VNLFGKSALDTPAPTDFHPELDTSDFLDKDRIWLYQSYIGIFSWATDSFGGDDGEVQRHAKERTS
jgi:hypothetical protein